MEAPAPGQNAHLVQQRMDQLSLQGGGLPPAPLTVQTSGGQMGQAQVMMPAPSIHQRPDFPQQQQQVMYHHQLQSCRFHPE